MKALDQPELLRAAELLDQIVRPGEHDIFPAIEEAQLLLGYQIERAKPRGIRSFYGIHKPKLKGKV